MNTSRLPRHIRQPLGVPPPHVPHVRRLPLTDRVGLRSARVRRVLEEAVDGPGGEHGGCSGEDAEGDDERGVHGVLTGSRERFGDGDGG